MPSESVDWRLDIYIGRDFSPTTSLAHVATGLEAIFHCSKVELC